jgi:hypothetical protein
MLIRRHEVDLDQENVEVGLSEPNCQSKYLENGYPTSYVKSGGTETLCAY